MIKNIAVVGCGHWGKNLVRNFSKLGSLKYICEQDKDIAEKLVKEFEVKNKSYKEILDNNSIDGVVLAVPALLHASMAISAMKAGKHVYVEKPLAMNQDEALKMIETSKVYKVHLMVGHLLQYHPVFKKLKKMVQQKNLGKLNYIQCRRLSLGKVRSEEDVVWSFAPHDISMILSVAKEDPISIRADSASILQPNIADLATLYLEFNSGLKASITLSWIHPFKEQEMIVIGEKGMMVFDDQATWDKKLALYQHQANLVNRKLEFSKADAQYLEVSQEEPLKLECQYFLDLIKDKAEPLTDGVEGLRVLRVLMAASQSLKENKIIGLSKYE